MNIYKKINYRLAMVSPSILKLTHPYSNAATVITVNLVLTFENRFLILKNSIFIIFKIFFKNLIFFNLFLKKDFKNTIDNNEKKIFSKINIAFKRYSSLVIDI